MSHLRSQKSLPFRAEQAGAVSSGFAFANSAVAKSLLALCAWLFFLLVPPLAAPQQSPDTKSAVAPEPERGYAAFYNSALEGHKTACGGVYSAEKFTAAHPKLPCGTRLRVTNLRNGKSVRVTVNDRSPLHGDRIIDLSYAAARTLNFIPQGTTLVKIEILR